MSIGLFHGWYRPEPPGQGTAASVTHKSAITDHAVEDNHMNDWNKAKVVDRDTAPDQMDKRGALDQEDTNMH